MTMADLDDPTLIASARQGNLDAFSQLVLRHQAGVRACLAVRMDNPHDAEDLAQEVFVWAFKKLDQVDSSRPLGFWLRGIALNLLRNHVRKSRALPMATLEDLQTLVDTAVESTYQSGGEQERYTAMRECIASLDMGARRLVKARYEDDVDVAELCRRLKKKHSAVTMQLHRIRQQLRTCVETRLSAAGNAT